MSDEIPRDGGPADGLNMPSLLLVTTGGAFVMMNLVSLCVVAMYGLGFVSLGAATLAAPTSGGGQDAWLGAAIVGLEGVAYLLVGGLIDVLGLIGAGGVILTGVRMRQLRSYEWVNIGAVATIVVPILSMVSAMCGGCGLCGIVAWMPLVALGTSTGAFALFALRKPGVREAFTS